MSTCVMGGILNVLRPISNSHLNINYCSKVARGILSVILWNISTSTIITTLITTMINSINARGRVAGILRSKSTSTIVTTMMNSKIERGRLDGLKIPMSASFIIHRQFKNFLIGNTIIIMTTRIIMEGLCISIYQTPTTNHLEITFSSDRVDTALFVLLMSPGNEPRWDEDLNWIRCEGWMVLVTGINQGRG